MPTRGSYLRAMSTARGKFTIPASRRGQVAFASVDVWGKAEKTKLLR